MELSKRAISHFEKHLKSSEALQWASIPKFTPYTIPIAAPTVFGTGWLIYIIFLMGNPEPSWEAFFRALYLLIPVYICLGIAILFIKQEDQAYAFSNEHLFIKKGNNQLVIINLQEIQKIEPGSFLFIKTLKIITRTKENASTLYDVKNVNQVYEQLDLFIKK